MDEDDDENVELDGDERQGKSGRDGKVSSANRKSSAASPPISSAGASPRSPPFSGGFSWECGGDETAEASMQIDTATDGGEMCRRLSV